MAKRKQNGPSLFDQMEIEEARAKPDECQHLPVTRRATETVWPGETCHRFTWTCECGFVWGRCP